MKKFMIALLILLLCGTGTVVIAAGNSSACNPSAASKNQISPETSRRVLDEVGGADLPVPTTLVINDDVLDHEYARHFKRRIASVYLWLVRVVLIKSSYDCGGGGETYIAHEYTHYRHDASGQYAEDASEQRTECGAYAAGREYALERGWFNRAREQDAGAQRYLC